MNLANPSQHGILHVPSMHPVGVTLDRLEEAARAHGLKVFARLDQAQEAEAVGLTLRATQVLLFGNPAAGTQLMQASVTAALDLPLRAVAWIDTRGQVWLTYDDPAYLGERHGLANDLVMLIAGIHMLVHQAASASPAGQDT
ncbi:DUF302 domain-containing protein [Deinococcus oregonensis]|uniref:DUF302 domain-containing protein n=1 Tax=Deinococcus oregonensis TaxID=1805970 RepID=A0ABV6AVU3_9DEIO